MLLKHVRVQRTGSACNRSHRTKLDSARADAKGGVPPRCLPQALHAKLGGALSRRLTRCECGHSHGLGLRVARFRWWRLEHGVDDFDPLSAVCAERNPQNTSLTPLQRTSASVCLRSTPISRNRGSPMSARGQSDAAVLCDATTTAIPSIADNYDPAT
jgi:hypothetical protein